MIPKRAKNPYKEQETRLKLIALSLSLVIVLIIARLVHVQIYKHSYYTKVAERQYKVSIKVPARRGSILDRNGYLLATDRSRVSFALDPWFLKKVNADLNWIATELSKIFGRSKEYYISKMRSNSRFVWIEKDASSREVFLFDSLVSSVKIKKKTWLRGIIKIKDFARYYPFGTLAGQLIGFVNSERKAMGGIELEYDEILKGKNGYIVMQRDALGEVKPSIEYPQVQPVDGYSVQLTIDHEIQFIAEEELSRAIEKFKAESGTVIVMNPRTGEILAMASYPEFNPNYYWLYKPDAMLNRAISEAFEPGSTFKIVPSAVLIEKRRVSPGTKISVGNGSSVVKGIKVVDPEPHKVLSFKDVIKYSSNIGMAKLSLRISPFEFFKYARNFGFGCYTGVNLPGESKGKLKFPDEWVPTTGVFMSFGYEITVTPLQLALAYSAIANDGVMVQPRVVKAIIDFNGKVVKRFKTVKVRRVVSEKTAKLLKKLLKNVVEDGTGKLAKIPGVSVAGKTGTSQKYENGRYSRSHYRASFVGFFPADDPEYLCLVVIESPKWGYFGGIVSAPVFRRIAERIIRSKGVKIDGENVVLKTSSSEQILKRERKKASLSSKMPDLRGLSLREALEIVSGINFKDVKIIGSGVVVGQFPKPGAKLNSKARLVLYCKPKLKNL